MTFIRPHGCHQAEEGAETGQGDLEDLAVAGGGRVGDEERDDAGGQQQGAQDPEAGDLPAPEVGFEHREEHGDVDDEHISWHGSHLSIGMPLNRHMAGQKANRPVGGSAGGFAGPPSTHGWNQASASRPGTVAENANPTGHAVSRQSALSPQGGPSCNWHSVRTPSFKRGGRMLFRAKLSAALLAVVVALAVLPVATASATVAKSSLCTSYKSEETKQSKASSALAKDIESGSWASIKKALLSAFNGEAGAEKQFAAYLSGAPAKVKAAAAVVLKLDGSFKTIIQNSNSLTSFESGITAAESSPKVKAALSTLDSYTTKLCGSTTPTT